MLACWRQVVDASGRSARGAPPARYADAFHRDADEVAMEQMQLSLWRSTAGRPGAKGGRNEITRKTNSAEGRVPAHQGPHKAPKISFTHLSLNHGAIDGSRADIERSWLARSSSHVEGECGGDRCASNHADRDFVFIGGEVRLRVAENVLQGVHRNFDLQRASCKRARCSKKHTLTGRFPWQSRRSGPFSACRPAPSSCWLSGPPRSTRAQSPGTRWSSA